MSGTWIVLGPVKARLGLEADCCLDRLEDSFRVSVGFFGLLDLSAVVNEAGAGDAGGGAEAGLRLRENQESEEKGVFGVVEVVEVTEDFRDNPIIDILLLSFSFSATLVDLEP